MGLRVPRRGSSPKQVGSQPRPLHSKIWSSLQIPPACALASVSYQQFSLERRSDPQDLIGFQTN